MSRAQENPHASSVSKAQDARRARVWVQRTEPGRDRCLGSSMQKGTSSLLRPLCSIRPFDGWTDGRTDGVGSTCSICFTWAEIQMFASPKNKSAVNQLSIAAAEGA